MSRTTRILIRPLVSEELERMASRLNQYGFEVDRNANKIEIKRAVEEYYNVTVVRVNTMNCMGKLRQRYTRTGFQVGRKRSTKKAIVTLQSGDTIDFFSNI